jgi:hypothetical protein
LKSFIINHYLIINIKKLETFNDKNNIKFFMGIGDWGLGIGDWGLGIGPNPQSPIPNPQSPIPIKNLFIYLILFNIII